MEKRGMEQQNSMMIDRPVSSFPNSRSDSKYKIFINFLKYKCDDWLCVPYVELGICLQVELSHLLVNVKEGV